MFCDVVKITFVEDGLEFQQLRYSSAVTSNIVCSNK